MFTAESNFFNFVIKYLGEIENEFENTLAFLSGAQVGSNHGKNRGCKSRDQLPFKSVKSTFTVQYTLTPCRCSQ